MLADLWNCPEPESDDPQHQWLGTSAIGSSEACILGGLAMKRAWQERRKKEGKDISKPNLVLGANAQVCWGAHSCTVLQAAHACLPADESMRLAMKRAWQERRKKEGKDISKPNLVLGANAQVCWGAQLAVLNAVRALHACLLACRHRAARR